MDDRKEVKKEKHRKIVYRREMLSNKEIYSTDALATVRGMGMR